MKNIRRVRVAMWCALALSAIQFSAATRLGAQDTQYWADAYGLQARLLGGAVIGSDADISAVYYNPGAVALADSLQLLISLNALKYASISFAIPGSATIPSSGGWSGVSNMTAGVIPVGGRDSHSRMAYSILSRQAFNFGAQLREITLQNVPPLVPPPIASLGNALIGQSLSEYWGGATYSTERGKRWGFGASLFIAIRSQTYSKSVSVQVTDVNFVSAIGIREYDYSYYNWAALLKFGVQYKGDDWGAGMTLTTPRLDLLGGSSVGTTRSYVDQGIGGGASSSQIATNYQMNLGSTYHSPLSVGAGVGKKWGPTALHLSAEWFAAVPQFTIIPAEPFTPQSGTATALPMALTAQYRSLVNVGVGIQHEFNPRYSLYGGFRTDNTSIPSGTRSVGTLINYNLMHGDVGVAATVGRAAVILGFDVAWGSQNGIETLADPVASLPAVPAVDESFFATTIEIGFRFSY